MPVYTIEEYQPAISPQGVYYPERGQLIIWNIKGHPTIAVTNEGHRFQCHGGGGGGVTFHGFLCGSGLGRQWWGRVAPTTRRRGLGSGGFVKEVACVLALAQIGW